MTQKFLGELSWNTEASKPKVLTNPKRLQRLISYLDGTPEEQPKPKFLGELQWLGAVSWKDKAHPSEEVKAVQSWLNKILDACGYYAIGIDGVVGPATCGAIAMMGDLKNVGCATASLWAQAPAAFYTIPAVCQGYTMPTKKGQTKPDKPTSKLTKDQYALPWQKADPTAAQVQGDINTALDAIDYNGIAITGMLDAQTCGALRLLQQKTGVNWEDAYGMNCQSFIMPTPKGGGGGGGKGGGGGGVECDDTKPCPPGQECVAGKCQQKVVSTTPSKSSGLGLFVLGAGALGLAWIASRSQMSQAYGRK